MNLASPMNSVIPSVHGAVLAVLARTHQPLTGRGVAALTTGAASQRRVNDVLGELVEAGIVLRERHPPANLYRLNRDHVAAPGIIALSHQWNTLLHLIREEVASWSVPPVSASIFGSAARGEAGSDSDVDILLVSRVHGPNEADTWDRQVDRLSQHVLDWSGNTCEILELSESDLDAARERNDRLVRDLRADAIAVGGRDVRAMLGATRTSA